MHCNVCDHVFLNPVFSNQIKNNLYSHKSLYRNFSLGESNEEYYLNTIGDNYNKSSSIFINFKKFISGPTGRKKFFLKLLSHSSQINKKLNVLDFGAGFGAAENDLSINNVKYVGVDIDPWCLKIAKKYNHNVLHPNQISKKFDIVFSWQVFEHIQNPNNGIKSALNYLKPNGLIGINVPTHEFSYFNNLTDAGLKCLNWGHYHSFTKNSFKYLFDQNNVSLIDFFYLHGDVNVIGRKNIYQNKKNKKIISKYNTKKSKILLSRHIFIANILRPIINTKMFIKTKIKQLIYN